MNDAELNRILSQAAVPERPRDFWEGFASRVLTEAKRREAGEGKARSRLCAETPSVQPATGRLALGRQRSVSAVACAASPRDAGGGFARVFARLLKPGALAWAAATVLVCVALGFYAQFKSTSHRAESAPGAAPDSFAVASKCYRELETLFPHRLQSVVFDSTGARLLLADKADVPVSRPVFVKICEAKGCEWLVTFSGQRVPVHGEPCDLLVDGRGDLLLVGKQTVWTSAQPGATADGVRIEARFLEGPS